jgi:hypothetical protein
MDTKDKDLLRAKQWYKDNKEKKRLYDIQYRQKHKKKRNDKSEKKSDWKRRGLNIDTFYYVYPIYTNTTHCDNCNVFLEGRGKNQKCMDHCHATGMFRNVLCKACNGKRR